MMRIITGKARGVRLSTLEGDHTRPTSERAKEAVFSMLQFDIVGARVLDLFAGSGQMGLEALSRGAQSAAFCDLSKSAIEIVKANAKKTRLEPACDIYCGDYKVFLQRLSGRKSFDMVFLDPPYAQSLVPQAINGLIKGKLLAQNARLVCETASPNDVFGGDEAMADRFEILKQTRYGIAHVTVLQYKGDDGRETE